MARRVPDPSLTATCHCGAVSLQLARRPREITKCNCSVCWRYGTLWCYQRRGTVRFAGTRSLEHYTRAGGELRFYRCTHCGCVTHWEHGRRPTDRMGVNTRLLPAATILDLPIRYLDGEATWKRIHDARWP
jgi:hypothetical protein